MKKIIYRLLILIFLFIFGSISFLSFFGIKTDKFNDQISKEVKKINNQLDLDLNEISIILDLFELKLVLKTIGADLNIKNKRIKLESIKSHLDIKSLINNQFSISGLDISTRSIEIKKLISFLRLINDNSQLFILEKLIKKGYLIADINLKFDDEGNINQNYTVKGFVKEGELKSFNDFKLSQINFNFNFKNQIFDLKDVKLIVDKNNILFPEIKIKKNIDKFFITGKSDNKDISLDSNQISKFLNNNQDSIRINSVEFDLNNIFSFSIDKKYNLKGLNVSSNLNLKKMNLSNKLKLKAYFPEINDNFDLINHNLKIDYKKNFLRIDGSGEILLQKNKDEIKYNFLKSNKELKFYSLVNIKKNLFNIDFLNFNKDINSDLNLIFEGKKNLSSNEILLENISIKEKDNLLDLQGLRLSKNFKIKSLNEINFVYFDNHLIKNQISIFRKNKDYYLNSKSFNSTKIIDDLLKSKKETKFKDIFNDGFKLNIKIDETFLDKNHIVNDLNGYLVIKNNKIIDANLTSFFSKNKKIKMTIRSNSNEKITTLYSDIAKPFVNRYKFIKGFEEGNLNFYSIESGKLSNSKLVIDNFKVQEVPALAKLLTLASLQGIADLLTGEGIRFSDFEMTYSNSENMIEIEELYAIGPAISILMDGYVKTNELISLRGTLVPATTINRTISSIPLIGNILVGKKVGEGVFGVSFKIKGPPKKLKTTVNPVKTLTPRFITRTLEKLKKD
tara:strand:+ start:1971 stop:4169 length:2199 start_codon:yes stop_codon:yes gene_type:complete